MEKVKITEWVKAELTEVVREKPAEKASKPEEKTERPTAPEEVRRSEA